MAGHSKRRKRGAEHNDHPDERWLVTYADLMTLLVALFMVLFSISSVNKSKFETLQHSLQDAFSGRILPGGNEEGRQDVGVVGVEALRAGGDRAQEVLAVLRLDQVAGVALQAVVEDRGV